MKAFAVISPEGEILLETIAKDKQTPELVFLINESLELRDWHIMAKQGYTIEPITIIRE